MTAEPLLSPKKRARLVEFLGSLPNGAATKLFAALERDRAAGGAALPHDLLLDSLRREIADRALAFPPRPPTAKRLFFTPFEDFFIAHREGRKRAGRIARSSIEPIWTLINEDPACVGAHRAVVAFGAAVREGAADPGPLEDAMFEAAADGLDRVLGPAAEDESYRAALRRRLGGEACLDDLEEVRLLLGAVRHLKAMQAAFPRPVGALAEEHLYQARRIYEAARSEAPEASAHVLLALVGRMAEPWRALGLHYHFARAGLDGAAVADSLFEDLESLARLLEQDAAGEFDPEDAARRLDHFADLAEGLAAEAGAAGDKVLLNRIEACRDVGADALARFAEQALAVLRKAMPLRRAGGSSRLVAQRPDYARPVSPRAGADAREAARFLAGVDALARRLVRPAAVNGVRADMVEEARRYADDVVAEIRAAEGEERVAARRLMEHALDIAAPLLPGDEIALLREKALAAAHTA